MAHFGGDIIEVISRFFFLSCTSSHLRGLGLGYVVAQVGRWFVAVRVCDDVWVGDPMGVDLVSR
jgi:hypothetical protein